MLWQTLPNLQPCSTCKRAASPRSLVPHLVHQVGRGGAQVLLHPLVHLRLIGPGQGSTSHCSVEGDSRALKCCWPEALELCRVASHVQVVRSSQ